MALKIKNQTGEAVQFPNGRLFPISRPAVVAIAGPKDVRAEPVVDPTKVTPAFFTAHGFMLTTRGQVKKGGKNLIFQANSIGDFAPSR